MTLYWYEKMQPPKWHQLCPYMRKTIHPPKRWHLKMIHKNCPNPISQTFTSIQNPQNLILIDRTRLPGCLKTCSKGQISKVIISPPNLDHFLSNTQPFRIMKKKFKLYTVPLNMYIPPEKDPWRIATPMKNIWFNHGPGHESLYLFLGVAAALAEPRVLSFISLSLLWRPGSDQKSERKGQKGPMGKNLGWLQGSLLGAFLLGPVFFFVGKGGGKKTMGKK